MLNYFWGTMVEAATTAGLLPAFPESHACPAISTQASPDL